jgi:putative colanic acid biosynthesis UDP-glucose lipid carrier transferase
MQRSVLKPHASAFAAILRALDPALTALVGLLAYHAYLSGTAPFERYAFFLAVAVVAVIGIFPLFRLYEPQRGASLADETRRLLLAWLMIGALAATILFATKTGDLFSRFWLGSWLLGSVAVAVALRVSLRLLLRKLRSRGHNLRHLAIVGGGGLGRQVVERLRNASWAGLNVVGVYDDDPGKLGTTVFGVPVLGSADRLATDVAPLGIDQVWIALPLRAEHRIRDILVTLREHPVEVRFVPDIYGFHLLNHSVTEIAGLPVIALTETPMSGVNQVVKRVMDVALSLLFLILAAPLMLVIVAGVRLSSPGPALFRQRRVTWNGVEFEIIKFRTMPLGAELETGPVFARPGDSRPTPFGAMLRRYSLDELPQLFNVLLGEMSLVGPRPERPEFVDRFRREIPGYMLKHLVKAGMTGWAQVNDLRGDTDLSRRIEYDLFYIENWSVWFDLRILAITAVKVLTSRSAC